MLIIFDKRFYQYVFLICLMASFNSHAHTEGETAVESNILNEIDSILYAGILSGGFAFVLQIYAQKNISPAPAAIIFSLEGVFATIAAWFLLDQILGVNNLLGCFFILCGVLLSQLLPLIKKTN